MTDVPDDVLVRLRSRTPGLRPHHGTDCQDDPPLLITCGDVNALVARIEGLEESIASHDAQHPESDYFEAEMRTQKARARKAEAELKHCPECSHIRHDLYPCDDDIDDCECRR